MTTKTTAEQLEQVINRIDGMYSDRNYISVGFWREIKPDLEAALTRLQDVEAENARLRDAVRTAWIAGYYHAGYTHDSAYAEQQAELYVKSKQEGEQQ